MDKYERDMFAVVNRNHDCKALADKLNAISARRRRKKSASRCARPEDGIGVSQHS